MIGQERSSSIHILTYAGSHGNHLNGNGSKEDGEEESIGHTLMNDIQNFLERKGAIVTGANGANKNGDDSSEDEEEEEEEDDTLQDDELGHCLPKDDDHHNTGCVRHLLISMWTIYFFRKKEFHLCYTQFRF